MNRTLRELGEEYLYQCRGIRAQIRMLRLLYKTAPAHQLRQIEQRIAVLYDEHGQLKRTGLHLVNYYTKPDAARSHEGHLLGTRLTKEVLQHEPQTLS